jgi:hypothetical protein
MPSASIRGFVGLRRNIRLHAIERRRRTIVRRRLS